MARQKGFKHSEETKMKMREARKLQPAPNKGRKGQFQHSEEQKAKWSKSRKGKTLSEETKQKMREAKKHLKGKPRSEEIRIKMSIGRGGNGNLDRKYPGCSAWRRRNIERTPYCHFCFSEDNLEAHHIIPKAKFPQYHDEDWNCRILCRDCHIVCHKQGGY